MRYKLTEIYNTKYFYRSYEKDLTYLFDSIEKIRTGKDLHPHAGSPLMEQLFEDVRNNKVIELDIANAKFTPDTVGKIVRCKVTLVDSEDRGRQDVLDFNTMANKNANLQTVYMPDFDGNSKVSDYIKSLDPNVIYTIPLHDEDLYLALIYMTMVLRPSIKITVTPNFERLFKRIASTLTFEDYAKYDEFYLVNKYGIRTIKLHDGKLLLEGNRYVTLEEAFEYGFLVPTVFGKERLYGVEPWQTIFTYCHNIVLSWENSNEHDIHEFLQ